MRWVSYAVLTENLVFDPGGPDAQVSQDSQRPSTGHLVYDIGEAPLAMKMEFFRHRPYLTGLLLGLPVYLIGNILRAEGIVWMMALLFIGAGVILGVYGNSWYKPAGKALAATGATMLLTPVVIAFTGTQAALGL